MKSAAGLNWIPIEHLRDHKAALYLVLLAVVPLLGFNFGSGNQMDQFPIIARMIDPGFAAGDFYIDVSSGFGPRFYYSKFMAVIVGATSFPFAVFVLSLLCNLATGVVTFLSARRFLGASVLAAAAAATLAVTNGGFALGLAGYIRFDSFQPASIALPVSLAGLYLAFSGRSFAAAPVFAIASLFHPLIGVESGLIGLGAFFLATAFRGKVNRERIRELVPQIIAGSVFLALVFAAWGVPSLMSATEKISDNEFFNSLIAFRSPHHYVTFVFPRTHYVSFFLFFLSVGAIVVHYARAVGLTRERKSLIITAAAVLILCAASALFVDILENRLYATAQVFRQLYLVKWIGFLFVGWMFARWLNDHGWTGLVFGVLVLISTGEAQSRALTLILLLSWISTHAIFTKQPILKWGLAAFSVAGVVYLHQLYGSGTESIRAIAATGVLILIFKFPLKEKLAMPAAVAAIALLVLFATVNRTERWIDKDALTPEFTWADLSGGDIDIAYWARANTPAGAVWATPPDFESFRIIAERAIIVDYTSIPFGDLALREWKLRMATLYGPLEGSGFIALNIMKKNYAAADSEQLRAAMKSYGADYAILNNSTPWDGQILYQNETYKAVKR